MMIEYMELKMVYFLSKGLTVRYNSLPEREIVHFSQQFCSWFMTNMESYGEGITAFLLRDLKKYYELLQMIEWLISLMKSGMSGHSAVSWPMRCSGPLVTIFWWRTLTTQNI